MVKREEAIYGENRSDKDDRTSAAPLMAAWWIV